MALDGLTLLEQMENEGVGLAVAEVEVEMALENIIMKRIKGTIMVVVLLKG